MKTPGDYMGHGVLIWLVGGGLTAFAMGGDGRLGVVLIAAVPLGLVGSVLVAVGVIAKGVAIGVKTATQSDERFR